MTNTLNHSSPEAAILERNRRFAAADGHLAAGIFPALRLLVIACLDPRVDPAHTLGLGLGDAMIIRNVGGRVTPEVIANVAFLGQLSGQVLGDGPLFEVAVVHHTQCGAGALVDDDFRQAHAARTGADEETLRRYAVTDPCESVARDVGLLRASEAVSPRITVSGHVYDVTTGLVETVISSTAGGSA